MGRPQKAVHGRASRVSPLHLHLSTTTTKLAATEAAKAAAEAATEAATVAAEAATVAVAATRAATAAALEASTKPHTLWRAAHHRCSSCCCCCCCCCCYWDCHGIYLWSICICVCCCVLCVVVLCVLTVCVTVCVSVFFWLGGRRMSLLVPRLRRRDIVNARVIMIMLPIDEYASYPLS